MLLSNSYNTGESLSYCLSKSLVIVCDISGRSIALASRAQSWYRELREYYA